jgi:hypothetical protein
MAISFPLQRVDEEGSPIGLAGAVSTSGAVASAVTVIAGAVAMAATFEA